MGMPVITPGTSTRAQAITDIVTSVALEETALAHILNAEGEKIQKIVASATTAEEMIAVNTSVQEMVEAVTQLELVLQAKLSLFEDAFATDSSTDSE